MTSDDVTKTELFGHALRVSNLKTPAFCFTCERKTFGKRLVNYNLVPRAHVPFGQHQDTKLWNNQFPETDPETKILGLPASRRMRGLVYMVSRDKSK